MCGGDRYDLGRPQVAPTEEIKIFCFIAYGYAFFNRHDIGQSATCCMDAPVPTNEIETFAFGYRPNKDLYVALHNKKETRGSLLSACLHLAFVLNYRSRMSL